MGRRPKPDPVPPDAHLPPAESNPFDFAAPPATPHGLRSRSEALAARRGAPVTPAGQPEAPPASVPCPAGRDGGAPVHKPPPPDRAALHGGANERAGVMATMGTMTDYIDKMMADLRDRLGVGFMVSVCAPRSLGPMVFASWDRLSALKAGVRHERRVFKPTLKECLEYIVAYEDIVDGDGEEAAHKWHVKQRSIHDEEQRKLIDENMKARMQGRL